MLMLLRPGKYSGIRPVTSWEDFLFSNSTSETLQFFWVSNIALDYKTAFKIDFGPQEVPEAENLHFYFLVGALPQVQNQFGKQFSNKVLYNYCSK